MFVLLMNMNGGKKFALTDLTPCDPSPCKNGGECVEEGGAAKCQCPPGYAGENCEGEKLQ